MALELSNTSWKVVFGDGARRRQRALPAGDFKHQRATELLVGTLRTNIVKKADNLVVPRGTNDLRYH